MTNLHAECSIDFDRRYSEDRKGVPMAEKIRMILDEYVRGIVKIYGEKLHSVILYGSYARGDYKADSDIDIMILVDMSELDIKEFRHKLSELTYDINEKYECDINPIAKSLDLFVQWEDAYPFYANIKNEGVSLYEAA